MAERFAEEGASVTVADIREEPREGGTPTVDVINEAGGEAQFVQTDVTDKDDVRETVDAAVEAYGPLDVMVNNAGVWPGAQPIEDVTVEEFHRVMNINAMGVFLGCQVATDVFREQDGGGTIVNTSSLSGLYGFEDSALYCTSKGGVSNLTRALAIEVAPEKIRVNAINPGVIDTAMAREGGVEDDVIENIPLHEWGTPEDVANAALFLASDESSHVTGINLVVDGGLAANGYW
jgi:NAD(P)-dependent dehydrogenase (short-subunit alcohol dehydrogenase family)